MTILDTSGVVDLLLGTGAHEEVRDLLAREGSVEAPDVVVFEILAVLRRGVLRGTVAPGRATAAVEDLGDVAVELFPSLPLRGRAWELRENLTAADALFVALAERIDQPLATKDARLAGTARSLGVRVVPLGGV